MVRGKGREGARDENRGNKMDVKRRRRAQDETSDRRSLFPPPLKFCAAVDRNWAICQHRRSAESDVFCFFPRPCAINASYFVIVLHILCPDSVGEEFSSNKKKIPKYLKAPAL